MNTPVWGAPAWHVQPWLPGGLPPDAGRDTAVQDAGEHFRATLAWGVPPPRLWNVWGHSQNGLLVGLTGRGRSITPPPPLRGSWQMQKRRSSHPKVMSASLGVEANFASSPSTSPQKSDVLKFTMKKNHNEKIHEYLPKEVQMFFICLEVSKQILL